MPLTSKFVRGVGQGEEVYIGSANLTGAGIDIKGEDKRNFEAGILTDDLAIVEQAMNNLMKCGLAYSARNANAKTSATTR